MGERAAFVEAVCLNPADDTVRLAYADWLMDGGNGVLGEFVKLYADLAPVHGFGDTELAKWALLRNLSVRAVVAEVHELRARLNKLVRTVRPDKWAPKLCGPGAVGYVRRGFLYAVSATMGGYLAGAERLFARHPVEGVRIVDRAPQFHGAALYRWRRESARAGAAGVPGPVFERMLLASGRSTRNHFATYATVADADGALSEALVDHGRALVGLPPLYARFTR